MFAVCGIDYDLSLSQFVEMALDGVHSLVLLKCFLSLQTSRHRDTREFTTDNEIHNCAA